MKINSSHDLYQSSKITFIADNKVGSNYAEEFALFINETEILSEILLIFSFYTHYVTYIEFFPQKFSKE